MNRGGSWNNDAANCRSGNRNRNQPDNRNNNLGFRPALNSAGMDVIALRLQMEQIVFQSEQVVAWSAKSNPGAAWLHRTPCRNWVIETNGPFVDGLVTL